MKAIRLHMLSNVGPAGALLLAGIILAAALMVGMLISTSHVGGGCSHIPLINGHPAYDCPSGLPRN